MSDMVKVSNEDLVWLAPGKTFSQVAEQWFAAGVGLAILTEDEHGARAMTATMDARVAAQKVKVVDTIGAGDAFNAGMLAGLNRAGYLSRDKMQHLARDELIAMLEFASRIAARAVGEAGAGIPAVYP